ncbi:MAG: hypothetical protein ACYDAS_01955 [Patescibacteria group bacterium]|jgi:hypothetical protein
MNNYTINYKAWSKMNIFEQMGNIYSEISRAFKAKRENNKQYETLSVTRALGLFDATIDTLIKKNSIRTKEVLRSKDQFISSLFSETFNEEDALELEKYFMYFAIAARIRK